MIRRIFMRHTLTVLVALCIGIFPTFAEAANKFWVGGTGNLDGSDTTHISDTTGGAGGAVYPAAGDTLIFDGSSGGGTVTVTAAVTMTAWTSSAHTGTIDTNGQTITLSGAWTNTGTATRTVTLGASTVSVGSQWQWATTTNLTFNAGTSTINWSAGNNVFAGGGLTYNVVAMTNVVNASISGANTFGTLSMAAGAACVGPNLSADQVITGTFSTTSATASRIYLKSSVKGTQRTITAGTNSLQKVDFQDIIGAGAANWDLSAITGGSGDAGGNSGITFTTADDNFWIGDTGSWSDSTQWSTTSGGAADGRVPLPQDAAYFDSNSFSAGSLTVTQDMPRIGSVDWTGVTNTPTWTTSTAASFFGSITLVSGMTLTGSTQTYTYEGRGSSTLTSGGKSWAKQFTCDAATGTLTLGDAFTTTSTLAANGGTFNGGGFNVTANNLSTATAGTVVAGSGTWTITAVSGTSWSVAAGSTFTANTSTVRLSGALSGAFTFAGGGKTYYNFENATTGAFALQFTGSNTFNTFDIDASAAARTVLFTAGTTTTVASMTRDSGSNVITLGSITASSHTLAKTGGALIIPLANVSVSWSTATPSGVFFALPAGSTDGGNNSGWTFGSPTTKGFAVP